MTERKYISLDERPESTRENERKGFNCQQVIVFRLGRWEIHFHFPDVHFSKLRVSL